MICEHLRITEPKLCLVCKHRKNCNQFGRQGGECYKDRSGVDSKGKTKSSGYLPDVAEARRIKAEKVEKIKKIVAGFKRVKPWQITLPDCSNRSTITSFEPLPIDVRRRNSHGWKSTLLDDGTFVKHCEQCGEEFVCVEGTRRLCDGCLEEICDMLGCSYVDATGVIKQSRRGGAT